METKFLLKCLSYRPLQWMHAAPPLKKRNSELKSDQKRLVDLEQKQKTMHSSTYQVPTLCLCASYKILPH